MVFYLITPNCFFYLNRILLNNRGFCVSLKDKLLEFRSISEQKLNGKFRNECIFFLSFPIYVLFDDEAIFYVNFLKLRK